MEDDLLAGTTIDSGTLMVPSGRPGPQGMPSWSPVTQDFEVPEIGETVEVTLEDANWVQVEAVIFIAGMIGLVRAVNGNTVTLLRVPNEAGIGPQGETGASAFDLAVEEGFEGTLPEWLESLVGLQGEQGGKGEPGDQGAAGLVNPFEHVLTVRMAGNQIITPGTWTLIAWDTVVVDTQGGWDNSLKRYTPTEPGLYLFQCLTPIMDHFTMLKNTEGSHDHQQQIMASRSQGASWFHTNTTVTYMNGTDFINTWVHTGEVEITPLTYRNELSAYRLPML